MTRMSKRLNSRCRFAVSPGVLAILLAGCASTNDVQTDEWGFSDPVVNADPIRHSDVAEAMDRQDEESGGFFGGDGPTIDDWSPKNFTKNWKRMTGRGPNRALAKQLFEAGQRQYDAAAEMPPGDERSARFLSAADQ